MLIVLLGLVESTKQTREFSPAPWSQIMDVPSMNFPHIFSVADTNLKKEINGLTQARHGGFAICYICSAKRSWWPKAKHKQCDLDSGSKVVDERLPAMEIQHHHAPSIRTIQACLPVFSITDMDFDYHIVEWTSADNGQSGFVQQVCTPISSNGSEHHFLH